MDVVVVTAGLGAVAAISVPIYLLVHHRSSETKRQNAALEELDKHLDKAFRRKRAASLDLYKAAARYQVSREDAEDLGIKKYGDLFRLALADGKITANERVQLNKLANILKVKDEQKSAMESELHALHVEEERRKLARQAEQLVDQKKKPPVEPKPAHSPAKKSDAPKPLALRASGDDRGTPAKPNLTACPDCGKMVSVSAPSCIHCGRPLRGKEVECYLTVSRAWDQVASLIDVAVLLDGELFMRLDNGGTRTAEISPGHHRIELTIFGILSGQPKDIRLSSSANFEVGSHKIYDFTLTAGFFQGEWCGEWSEKIR